MRRLRLLLLAAAVVGASSTAIWAANTLAVRARLATDYTALKERPLFSPNRQAPVTFSEPEPEPVAAAPEPPPPPPPPAAAPEWRLVGLVRSEKLNSATFTAPGVEAAFNLRTGESRDGWTLTEVKRFEVVLDGAGGRASLRFPDDESADGAPAMSMDGEIGAMPGGAPAESMQVADPAPEPLQGDTVPVVPPADADAAKAGPISSESLQ